MHRIVVAIDSGYVVNPDTCRAQAESNVVYGLGSILYQENNVKDGRIVESNFARLPPAADLRDAEGGNRARAHGRLLGRSRRTGDPSPGAVPSATRSSAATGKRIRSLPLTHHDLRSA